jgi:geranylgeranyl pyrophosphate synthase
VSERLRLLDSPDRKRVRRAFGSLLRPSPDLEPHLAAVIAEATGNPGSLARAQLIYGIAAGSGLPSGDALRLATAIEYFHAASLILDDMPAMDDALTRRGRACPHVVHGEAAATLGALALITRAYALLWEALDRIPAARRRKAAGLVDACLGAEGILDGQARDVHFGHEARAGEVLRVALGKTVPLIRLAVVLPALASGAPMRAIRHLETLSRAWGLAYQILDDFKDVLLTDAEAGKTTSRDRRLGRPNLPQRAGWRRALVRLDGLLDEARQALDGARLARQASIPLARLQEALERTRGEVVTRVARNAA